MALIDVFTEITTTTTVDVDRTKAALIVYGSQDGKQWIPVAGTLNYKKWFEKVVISPASGVYKFFITCFAARIERSELKEMDFRYQERYWNKVR